MTGLRTAALGIVFLAAGCGTPAQSPDTVLMTVQEGGSAITGSYRPEGFSQAQGRSMVGRICTSAGFAGFNQTINGNIATFSASCAGQTKYANGGDAVFSRQEDSSVTYVVRYTQNGRALQDDGSLRI